MSFLPVGISISDIIIGGGAIVMAFVSYKKGWLAFHKPIANFAINILDRVRGVHKLQQTINTVFLPALQRIEANQELQKQNGAMATALQNALMNIIGLCVFKTDLSGLWIHVNRNLVNLTGMQYRDMLDNGWISCIAPKDRVRVCQEFDSSIEDGRTTEIDFDLINRDKKYVHVMLRTHKIECAEKVNFGFIGSIMIIDN